MFASFPQENRRDAQLVDFFRKQGVPAQQLMYLKDEQATTRRVKAAFTSLLSKTSDGDLLFFYQPWVQRFPYHVMIFLGPARLSVNAANGANDWVVYHTGSSPTDKGTVKKVELSVLDQHPDPRWRPVESNKNFLGFYRLKILQ